MDKASADLAALTADLVVNTDVKTLARYLSAVGINVSVDRMMDVVTVFTVLIVETGAGLSVALAMVLAPFPARPSVMSDAGDQPAAQQTVPSAPAPVAAPALPASPLLVWLEGQGGKATTSIRKLADSLGRSPSSIYLEVKRLARDGVIAMRSRPKGTVINLRRH